MRQLTPNHSYHITTRCNNREFRLTRLESRQILLYTLQKTMSKYNFKLYAICIMSNHVHYLIRPENHQELPEIMKLINWYSAMCFNRMLKRTGHFWEKRYHSTGFPDTDKRRALNTIRYIHANPKTAGMQEGFFFDFSNYGVYERLGDDGLTTWHPAFLALGESLDECAEKYRKFCYNYKPPAKKENRFHWGSRLLPKIAKLTQGKDKKKKPKKRDSEEQRFWEIWKANNPEIIAVADKFILANCYNPNVVGQFLENHYQ